jgi:hypothetical protein
MENKIVLGFPYAGAFLWLLNAKQQYGKSIKEKYDGSHPYYKTLFGSKHDKIIDETVSLSLLFDEIYLAPVDAYLPKHEKYTTDQMYFNTELGIKMNWDWSTYTNHNEWEKELDLLLKDNEILSILKKVLPEARKQIIREAIDQINISHMFDASIFAISSYLTLCNRLNEILNITKSLKTINSNFSTAAISTVFNISSLHFSINNLDEFTYLRQQSDLKLYAKSFRNQLEELPNGDFNELKLYEAMLKAINTESIADKISGGIALTATINGFASFIPGAGLVTGVNTLVLDAGGRIANKVSNNNKWWLIAPEISKQLTKHRLEKLYIEKKAATNTRF